jgi:hypothetical protein
MSFDSGRVGRMLGLAGQGYAPHVGILSDPKALEEVDRVLEGRTRPAKAARAGS